MCFGCTNPSKGSKKVQSKEGVSQLDTGQDKSL